MRQAALAIFVALGFCAAAEEGPFLTPRIRVPGESAIPPEIVIPAPIMGGWKSKMTDADWNKLVGDLKDLNGARKKLMGDLGKAKDELKAAQKTYNDTLAALDQQVLTVQKMIETRLGAEPAKEYAIRAELQPYINWLALTDVQVGNIVEKEKKLLADDPRPKIIEAARMPHEPKTIDPNATPEKQKEQRETFAAERAKQIDTLKNFIDFDKKWLDAIKSELTDPQKKLWDERYRRTQYLIEAPKAEAGK